MTLSLRTVIVCLLGLLIVALAATEGRASLYKTDGPMSQSPLLTPVRTLKCLVLDRQGGFESIVNFCDECRTAKVSRKRPGQNLIHRTLPIPGNKKVSTPFRGPGKTRIITETFCGNKDPATKRENDRQCVGIRPMRKTAFTLVNVCEKCRQVVIEREAGKGQKTRTVSVVNGRSYMPLPQEGMVNARIIDERACR